MRRETWAIGALVGVLVAAGVAVGVRVVDNGAFAGPPSIQENVTAADPGGLTIQWLGDMMLGDAAQKVLATNGYDWALSQVASKVAADVVIANAESPITLSTEPWGPDKPYSYQASPAAAKAMADAGIDIVSLANNHAMDRGPAGLADTKANFEKVGISSFGAGDTIDTAREPIMIRTKGRTVAVLGFGEYFGRASSASERRPGVVVMGPQTIDDGFARAKAAGADDVVAFVHWGDNYQDVNEAQRSMAPLFAKAGYRMVVGSGPHIVQPISVVNGMPVVYSLGNFVFGANGRFTKFNKQGFGLMATTQFHDDATITMTLRCINTDNDTVAFQPRPCSATQAADFLPTLNPGITVKGDVGTLKLPAR